MKKHLWVSALIALLLLPFAALPAQAASAKIWIQNNSSAIIYNVYVAQPGDSSYGYGGDLLGDYQINPGDGSWVYPPYTPSCKYYVEVRLKDGRTSTGSGKLLPSCGPRGSTFTLYGN